MAERNEGVGVSRRRIIQGAAWATPAVLVATALPAAAATGDPPGTIAFNGTYFTNDNGVNDVLNLVVRHGGPFNADDLRNISVTIQIASANVEAVPASVTGSGWALSSATVSGSNYLYVATYVGAVARYDTATTLVIYWTAKGLAPYPVTAYFVATASSGGTTVSGSDSATRVG